MVSEPWSSEKSSEWSIQLVQLPLDLDFLIFYTITTLERLWHVGPVTSLQYLLCCEWGLHISKVILSMRQMHKMVRVPVCSDVRGLWQYATTDTLPVLSFYHSLLLNKNLVWEASLTIRTCYILSNMCDCQIWNGSASFIVLVFPQNPPSFLHKGSVMFQGCDKSVHIFFKNTGEAPEEEFDFCSRLLSCTHTHTLTHSHPLKPSRDAKYVAAPLTIPNTHHMPGNRSA